ncbi:CubicO group peptidase (beta-lactamase class C family) [Chitinophaga dinghuensis]|uniref:CubicO group peptidase (Beta-lactamase class C family) n=1 Tax=Chitinophaga dinghuensis TaxID=1539050 RepID=A0A327VQK6_9BACT|nr:serine hydrolase [Chitinophaga dinghuensis]RAJ76756.1 CubicO group peptidase (beta-lactamase class C family) [Chitinophaga dinghuensis]
MTRFLLRIFFGVIGCWNVAVQAQSDTAVTGKVLDAQTHEPIPGANITIRQRGTVSNSTGNFRLNILVSALPDSLSISCLGYQGGRVSVAAQLKHAGEPILLYPGKLELGTVTVTARDALKLIRAAIDRIPDNYLVQPYRARGFYRNTTIKDRDYMQLSEAVFDICSKGYTNDAGNDLYLLQQRHIMDEKGAHGLDLGLKPVTLFDFDVVKTITRHPVFSEEGLKQHRFYVKGVVDYNGIPAFEIQFDQRAALKKSLYRGRLFLDTTHLVFLETDYELSPKGLPYNSYGDLATKALMNIFDIHIRIRHDGAKVIYRKIGERWTLSNVVSNTGLQLYSNRNHYRFNTNSKVDYIITQVDTTTDKPSVEARFVGRNKIIEFQNTPQEPAFWRKHTIILPEVDAEAIASLLKARNESIHLKRRLEKNWQRLPQSPAEKIDSILTFYNREKQFNGSALIKTKAGILLSKSYGFADSSKQLAADANTQYRIGSLSKPFTAILILQLEKEGKLSVKDTIGQYLPDYPHGGITIEQLLTHQSGIPNFTTNATSLSAIFQKALSLDEVVRKYCSDSLEFEPGTQFQYSNSGYIVLALLAEKISGMPFPKLLKERIFVPAGMQDSYVSIDTFTGQKLATGYLYGKPEPAYPGANLMGAGNIVATTADLCRWHQALSDNRFLDEQQMAAMFKPRAEYTDWNAWYDYGWMTDQRLFKVSLTGHTVQYHGGTDLGFYSMLARQPAEGNLVILLNNTGDFPRFDITDLILNVLQETADTTNK